MHREVEEAISCECKIKIKISCSERVKERENVRMQFHFKKRNGTKHLERIKNLIALEMRQNEKHPHSYSSKFEVEMCH